jgi:hypothetical protein
MTPWIAATKFNFGNNFIPWLAKQFRPQVRLISRDCVQDTPKAVHIAHETKRDRVASDVDGTGSGIANGLVVQVQTLALVLRPWA